MHLDLHEGDRRPYPARDTLNPNGRRRRPDAQGHRVETDAARVGARPGDHHLNAHVAEAGRGAGPHAPDRPGLTIIGVDDGAWDEALANASPSIFHTAGYHRYSRGLGAGEPYLAVAGDRCRGIAWPYLLRTIDETGSGNTEGLDLASAYGYPGPLAWGDGLERAFVDAALTALADRWRRQGVVSVFTRFNPLLGNAAIVTGRTAQADGLAAAGVVQGGHTVSVDLALDDEGVRRGYGRDLARQIRQGRRAGLRTLHDVDWTFLPDFAELYLEVMDRLGAAGFYRFGQRDFAALRAELPDRVHLLVTLLGGRVAAAGLFLEHGGVVDWHLVGATDELRELSPTKVLVDDAIRWARARGNQVLHLGGGRGGHEDSLYFFKSRFSPRRHAFATGRWILQPTAYESLASARREALEPGTRLDADYFPTYRAPALPIDGETVAGA